MEKTNKNAAGINKHRRGGAGLKNNTGQLFIYAAVAVLLFFVLLPIFIMLSKSVKTPLQDSESPIWPAFPFAWDNYSLAWLEVKSYIFNSFLVAVYQTGGAMLVCSLASFGFTRFHFRGKKALFMGVLSLMMIPGILTLIPQYVLVLNTFGLGNSYSGVALPAIAGAVPMGIFLCNTFFEGLPKDLFEAAELDGASKLRQYFTLTLPLSLPILATFGLMQFMGAWNDLLWPRLILQREEMRTITIGLAPFTDSYFNAVGSFSVPMAGYVIVSVPLIAVFALTSRQFIRGLTSGAFKM